MSYAIGIGIAVITGVLVRLAGFDRDRAVYPIVLIVTASYYLLFAIMGGSMHALLIEMIAMSVFATLAIIGFRTNLWLVAIGLVGHAVFDSVHHRLVSNPGVPTWWPGFCLSFDVLLALIVAWHLRSRPLSKRAELPG